MDHGGASAAMKPPRIVIHREGPEDRVTDGTKRARNEKPPLGVQVRYGIAIVAAGLACYFALHALAGIRHVEFQACQRENTKTRSDNNAHLGDFVVFSFVDARFLRPTHTETAAQKAITLAFAGDLRGAVTDSSWTPVTDCHRAVYGDNGSYTQPASVPFTKRLPPANDLPPRSGP